MTTTYYCKTCNATFQGDDPVRFGSLPAPSYPSCPQGMADALKLLQSDPDAPEWREGVVRFNNPQYQAMLVASRRHEVDLNTAELKVVEKPAVQPTVQAVQQPTVVQKPTLAQMLKGNGAPVVIALPPKPKPSPLALRAAALLTRVDKLCRNAEGGTSAKYVYDKLHPAANSAPIYETAAVIAEACKVWEGRATAHPDLNFHAMPPQFKNDWRQRTEVDFIRLITAGQKGRHIVHVIVGTKDEEGRWMPA